MLWKRPCSFLHHQEPEVKSPPELGEALHYPGRDGLLSSLATSLNFLVFLIFCYVNQNVT